MDNCPLLNQANYQDMRQADTQVFLQEYPLDSDDNNIFLVSHRMHLDRQAPWTYINNLFPTNLCKGRERRRQLGRREAIGLIYRTQGLFESVLYLIYAEHL